MNGLLNSCHAELRTVKRLETGIPPKIKLNFSAEDKLKYQKILREGRLGLTKQGVYDATIFFKNMINICV